VVQNHPVYLAEVVPALQCLNRIDHVIGHTKGLLDTPEGQAPFESEEFKDIRYDIRDLRLRSRDLRRNVKNRIDAVDSGAFPIEQMSNNHQHTQDLFHLRNYAFRFTDLRTRFNNEINRTASSVDQIPPFERTDSEVRNFGRDADLVVMVDCQIPADDLVVHFL